ncbi:hypothetical protein ABPG72_014549 [Tetrahymena utriculariae]
MLTFSKKFLFSSKKLKDCYIVAAKRTPIYPYLGKLAKFRAPDLAGFCIQSAIRDIKLQPDQIDEVFLGIALPAMIGQNPAKQAALLGGVDIQIPCSTINKACSSGLKSVVVGSNSIKVGYNQCVVTGGFESMSNVPYYIYQQRRGKQFGDSKLLDGILTDGVQDKYSEQPLGYLAEQLCKNMKFQKQTVDAVAIASYERAIEARDNGYLAKQISSIQYLDGQGKVFNIDNDANLEQYDQEKILNDTAFYAKEGIITQSNQSNFADGAATLILMSEEMVKQQNIKPLARILGYQQIEKEPLEYALASVESCSQLIKQANIKKFNIDLFEINEDFPSTVLAHLVQLDIDFEKVNVFGGTIAFGNPLGMTGARLLVNLVHGLREKKGKYGIATLGNAGGGSTSVLIESLQ